MRSSWTIAIAIVAVATVAFFVMRGGQPKDQHATTASPQARAVAPSNEPDPAPTAPPTVTSPPPSLVDHAAFLHRARAADLRRNLKSPDLPRDVSDLVLAGRVQDAANTLDVRARAGNPDANVMLVRLWHFCVDMTQHEWPARPASADGTAAAARFDEALRYQASLRTACVSTQFDKTGIQARLLDAANAGHAASLFMLGEDSSDLLARRRYWLSAAMLGDGQAQLALIDLLAREETASGVDNGGANFWTEVAAKELPEAQVKLAVCRLSGCDGRPADTGAAAEQLRGAARRGDETALEILSLVQPGPDAEQFDVPADERYAWTQFQKRLRDRGCHGEGAFALGNEENDRLIAQIEQEISPSALQSGKKLAATYWDQFGAAAISAQRCN